jgi:hypothetical protein
MFRKLEPSRTFTVALAGLVFLAILALGLFGALAWALAENLPRLSGRIVSALQVVAGCIATVATAGAGSMAVRDWSSGGLTSSQAPRVLAARAPALRSGSSPPADLGDP